MVRIVEATLVLVSVMGGISCRYITDPGDLKNQQEFEQTGLLSFKADTLEFRADNAFAEQISTVPDARVYVRLEQGGRAVYFDALFRIIRSNSSVGLTNLTIRFGDIDSSAEFYQMRPPTSGFFSILTIGANDVIEGSFMGQLEGTGTKALGKTLTIRNGIIKVAFRPSPTI
jgi:hypothetical protein